MALVSRRLLLSVLCAISAACTDSRGEDAGAVIDAREGSLALLQLERFADNSSGAASGPSTSEELLPRIVVGAKIARYRAIDGDALLSLLGADVRDLDSCNVSGGLGELALGPDARVELLSVGDIHLRRGDAQSTFSPRLFPALAATASGWFYAGEADVSSPVADLLDEYVLSAPGESGVGAFDAAVAAPFAVTGLALSGQALEARSAKGEQNLEALSTLVRSGNVDLSWEAEDAGDRVELELYAGGSVLACTLRDDGHFVLGATQLAALEADENASLLVRRVRVVPLDMHGIHSAYVRMATSRTLSLHVR